MPGDAGLPPEPRVAPAPASAAVAPPPTPPADAWRAALVAAGPELRTLASHPATPRPWPVPRAAALDAARLDDELTALLGEQASLALAAVAPARAGAWSSDLRAGLSALVFAATVAAGRPTPGMALLGLRYVSDAGSGAGAAAVPGGRDGASGPGPTPARAAALGLATIALRHAWESAAARGGLRWLASAAPAAHRAVAAADDAVAYASLLNTLAFLAGGRYRTLAERLLRLALVPADPGVPRALSFDYLNRQLVWHEAAQLVLAVLPLIDARSVGRTLRKVLPASGLGGGGGGGGGGSGGDAPPRAARGAAGPCGVCGAAAPATPFAALPCLHPHCYYCLASACAGDGGHACWCGARVAAMVRVRREA